MQDKQLTTVSYAAGASLAAIALVYVFAPTFAHEQSSTSSTRKKGVIGLRNYANDCFINSTLQALAGLGELRLYLIRETHRRAVDDPSVYTTLVQDPNRTLPAWKVQSLQNGAVTQGLKDMLDALNERPIYKKSTSAQDFVKVLEAAFKQRISRQQQDAQEFLQIVAERIKDEYHAGERAREHARATAAGQGAPAENGVNSDDVQKRLEGLAVAAAEQSDYTTASGTSSSLNLAVPSVQTVANANGGSSAATPTSDEEEDGFPMEGQHESQLLCQTCGHQSSPRAETFVMLTLNVPQVRSTSLSQCFDEIFKTEYIDDFKCEKCRLIHAEELMKKQLAKAPENDKAKLEQDIAKLRLAIDTDPENPPLDIDLPDLSNAPKRRIARSARITRFPKILAIHLSRSVFEAKASTKNSAKVSFPETLPLGGLTDRRNYKLLGLVTHRGSHNSGHYESFRRQARGHAPYLNTNPFQVSGIYSKSASPASTPLLNATSRADSPAASTPDLLASFTPSSSTPSLDSPSRRSSSRLRHRLSPTSAPRDDSDSPSPLAQSTTPPKDAETSSLRSVAASTRSKMSKISLSRGDRTPSSSDGHTPLPVPPAVQLPPASSSSRRRRTPDRWWRISDEKIKEAKTSEVLGMQREVYILFYEMERPGEQ